MIKAIFPLAILAIAILPSPAQADFGFAPGSVSIRVLDTAGEPYNRAGGPPDRVEVSFALNEDEGVVEGNPKESVIDFPPGFAGNPTAVPACPRRVFDGGVFSEEDCPPETQVGVAEFRVPGDAGSVTEPIYNVEAAPDELALLGFNLFGKTPLVMRMRPGDLGLRIDQRDLVQTVPLAHSKVVLWGFPGDHQKGTSIPRRAFLVMPTRCDGPLSLTVRAWSWQRPDKEVAASADTGVPLEGCDSLPFAPSLSFELSNPSADSPTGATLDLAMPPPSESGDASQASIESGDLALPEGVSISPGAARALVTCSEDGFGLDSSRLVDCPASSRIGTAELTAPQLREPVPGRVFLGEPRAGQRLRLFVAARGAGLDAKLAGELGVDPASNRLTMSLERLPDLAFSRFRISFDDGPAALLATPLACGTTTARGVFADGGGRAASSSDAVSISRAAAGGDCPSQPPFAPQLDGGTDRVRAGRSAALSLTLRRRDGDQLTDRFSITLPPGLSARVGLLGLCPEVQAMAAACSPEGRIGSAVAEIGPGAAPLVMGGDVFLTGPRRGAPFGMAIELDAPPGPFDPGALVVRGSLRIDPISGRLTLETDRLPRSIEGLAARFRTIGLDIDRPGFVRLPTSCAPASIDAEARSVERAVVRTSVPFQVRGCDSLPFAPRLSVRLTAAGKRGGEDRPGLRIEIGARVKDASLRGVDVALPAALRQGPGLRSICARRDALDGRCPDRSRVGRASGRTPLFAESLSGSIHVVQPAGNGPPELWTELGAGGARLSVRGEVLSRGGRLHTRLVGLPDVPLSRFVMRLDSGPHGLLALRGGACERDYVRAAFEGHNGAYRIRRARVEGRFCVRSARSPEPSHSRHERDG